MSTMNNPFITDEELFQELYDSFDVPDITCFDSKSFIKSCEEKYGMDTVTFMKWFKEIGYEGNVDMQLWFKHAETI